MTAVPVIDQVLDPSDVELHAGRDSLDLADYLARRFELLDPHAVLLGVDRARGARKLLAVGGLADVGRAEIERILGWINVDGVEKLAVENLDARDVPVVKRCQFLGEGDLVDPHVDRTRLGSCRERLRAIEAGDAGPASADVGFHDYRKAEALRGLRSEGGIVDDPRLGIREPKLVEDVELERLGSLHLIGHGSVHDGNADALQVPQPAQRVEGDLSVAAEIRGRARPVEDQRIWRLTLGRIVRVRRGVHSHIWNPSPVQLGEEWPEPVGVLVVDRDRSIGCCGHSSPRR